MSKEIKDINEKFVGLQPHDFSTFGPHVETRFDKLFHSEYTWNDSYMNINDYPHHTDTAIIVTSWCGQLRWLKAALESYRRSGAYVILSYDILFNVWDGDLEADNKFFTMLPRPLHHLLAHSVVFKHKTYDADKRTGWFWDVKYAQGIINMFPNIKYVYCTNGDCIIEKPDGFPKLIEILGDGDLMSGQTQNGLIHTADVLYKKEAFNKIVDYMTDRCKVTVIGGQSPEMLLRDAVNVLKLKETVAPKQPIDARDGVSVDFYGTQNADSTWKEVLGFRNLYGEHEYRENNALEPLPKEYADSFHNWLYYPSHERETICKYYETGDRRYIYQHWDAGDDSWYNRLYYPLDHYSKTPIYAIDTNFHGGGINEK